MPQSRAALGCFSARRVGRSFPPFLTRGGSARAVYAIALACVNESRHQLVDEEFRLRRLANGNAHAHDVDAGLTWRQRARGRRCVSAEPALRERLDDHLVIGPALNLNLRPNSLLDPNGEVAELRRSDLATEF
jgi:hypothetical protein